MASGSIRLQILYTDDVSLFAELLELLVSVPEVFQE